jgi:hypothetical protein
MAELDVQGAGRLRFFAGLDFTKPSRPSTAPQGPDVGEFANTALISLAYLSKTTPDT